MWGGVFVVLLTGLALAAFCSRHRILLESKKASTRRQNNISNVLREINFLESETKSLEFTKKKSFLIIVKGAENATEEHGLIQRDPKCALLKSPAILEKKVSRSTVTPYFLQNIFQNNKITSITSNDT
ncbi:hypothetical protein CEXT_656941 [Caerostris extrusa]|uniref:ATP synthase F0 subunit 8 n=1 Tax=Caerostris extrusa TaxID=172846 RepID=A0AAV4TBC7_CAEEX|nr:hypothetical protein CEXT_656941 [Caerostris extrusa]